MPHTLQSPLSFLARAAIVAIYVLSALGNKIPQFSNVTQYMASEGVPAPQFLLAGAIVFLLAGGLSVLLGFQARLGAALLLIFLGLATYFFHDFWTFEGQERQLQMIQFMKNVSLMGTMLFLIANGAGAGSLDARFAARRPGG